MKLLIAGSRNWPTDFLIDKLVSRLPKDTLIIAGEARGVDTWAKQASVRYGLAYQGFPADWKRWGQGAGKIRNAEMVAFADEVVCFHYGDSPGTAHTIMLAKQAGLPLTVFEKAPDDDGLGIAVYVYGPPSQLEAGS